MGNKPGIIRERTLGRGTEKPSKDRGEDKLEEIAEVDFESALSGGKTCACYKGIWQGLEVAIKQFKEEGSITEFITELTILRKVGQHPLIVNYLACNERKRFIVLEFVVNGTLSDLLQSDHTLYWPDRFSIASDIVRGMAFLHKNGIIHADLRSSNVLVTTFSPYKVKIFDFASSKLETDPNITQGEWLGDIRWQPPEVCSRRNDKLTIIQYPFKVDVFCFGMVLYELVSSTPWKELELNSMVMRNTIEGLRPKLPEDIPSQYADVIKRCWEADPTKRPAFVEMETIFQQLDIHGPQLEIKSNV